MISDELRRVIRESGETHYRVGKDCRIDTRTLDRFVNDGANVVSDSIDRLCDHFGLELHRKKGRTAAKQPAKKRATTGKRPAKKAAKRK